MIFIDKISVLALVGNKVDLLDQEAVNYDEAANYAKVSRYLLGFYEKSVGIRSDFQIN